MPIETIKFNSRLYPAFQANGFAARFAFPFAKEVCHGIGVDVGCNRIEWSFPGSLPVDPLINGLTATSYDYRDLDYVFSSHCLEHIPDWVGTLNYWINSLKPSGVLFLYLPDFSQEYWRPWNNRKHIHVFHPYMIDSFLRSCESLENVFVSGVDAYNSFICMAQKVTPQDI